jgi:hypothetical protein
MESIIHFEVWKFTIFFTKSYYFYNATSLFNLKLYKIVPAIILSFYFALVALSPLTWTKRKTQAHQNK